MTLTADGAIASAETFHGQFARDIATSLKTSSESFKIAPKPCQIITLALLFFRKPHKQAVSAPLTMPDNGSYLA